MRVPERLRDTWHRDEKWLAELPQVVSDLAQRRDLALEEPRPRPTPTRKLHKRLHTYRKIDAWQVDLNTKAQTCGAFAKHSDGLEPSTPSLPSSDEGNRGARWISSRVRLAYVP
jgi:hypothetical protein